jgi:hypothetical protein
LLSGTANDLAPLLREVTDGIGVPVEGVVSDGQTSIRRAGCQYRLNSPQMCRLKIPQFVLL